MKKIVTLLTAMLLLANTIAIAMTESMDLSVLSFIDLAALKQKVDYEYNSRKEAEPFKLAEGQYVVGIDIAPGRYYMACVEPSDTGVFVTRLHIFEDKTKYNVTNYLYGDYFFDEYFDFGEEPLSVNLEKGNFLLLQYGSLLVSMTPFIVSDYIHYDLPQGTLVPSGVYEIGEKGDIPAGKYQAFAGSVAGGELKIYYSKEKYNSDRFLRLSYDKNYVFMATRDPKPVGVVLEEGYVLLVEQDVVMKKQHSLIFD